MKNINLTTHLSFVSFLILLFAGSCDSGKDLEDKTLGYSDNSIPTLSTTLVSTITNVSATSGGNVTDNGGVSVTSRGVCWSTSSSPTTSHSTKTSDGSGSGAFSSTISGLTASTTYYVRAYAVNSVGTAYGNEVSFKTAAAGVVGSVTDIEGNVYKTITIGTQEWMTENLRTTKYRDGTNIPLVDDNTIWRNNVSSDAYCNYDNNNSNASTYGHLYNWFAVNSSHNIAPAGWHVPTIEEWNTLINYLGGEAVAGGKMKETGTTHWTSPNTSADNSSGFTALPGGNRSGDTGLFFNIGSNGYWWSSTQYDATNATLLTLFNSTSTITQANKIKKAGYSVLCVKN